MDKIDWKMLAQRYITHFAILAALMMVVNGTISTQKQSLPEIALYAGSMALIITIFQQTQKR
jgi:hypothetical protein